MLTTAWAKSKLRQYNNRHIKTTSEAIEKMADHKPDEIAESQKIDFVTLGMFIIGM